MPWLCFSCSLECGGAKLLERIVFGADGCTQSKDSPLIILGKAKQLYSHLGNQEPRQASACSLALEEHTVLGLCPAVSMFGRGQPDIEQSTRLRLFSRPWKVRLVFAHQP